MRFSRFLAPLTTLAVLGLAACGGGAAPASSAPASPTAASPAAAASKPAAAASASAKPAASGAASAKPAASGAAGAKTANIGAAFSLTGPGSPYGPVQKNAVLLAQDDLNKAGGVTLNIDVQDDASAKEQGINVFQSFIKGNDVAIMGPTLSGLALATDPLAQDAKTPVLGVSNTAGGITTIGDYIFRDSLAEEQVVPAMVKAVVDKYNPKKVAIMYANDQPFAKSGADAVKKEMDDRKIQVTDTETFASNDKDFSAQLTKIKGTNPDAIFISALADAGANIVAQARKLGIPDSVHIIGGNGMNSPQIAKIAGPAAEGIIVGAAWIDSSPNPQSQAFVKAYKAKYNLDPDQFAAQAYAGVQILSDALKRANLSGDTAKDRTALRDALAQTKNVDTVLGKFSFTSGRDADHPPVVQVIKDGKFVLFS
ncbi:MAG TPA: ABC transporter substrate-binding protein [Chloroflexota bacterium]|nr:ABC transporter substrate-binding protein [Chloroflexota bacterium]